jgi:hypothetical protein
MTGMKSLLRTKPLKTRYKIDLFTNLCYTIDIFLRREMKGVLADFTPA